MLRVYALVRDETNNLPGACSGGSTGSDRGESRVDYELGAIVALRAAYVDLQRALTLESRKWVKGRVHAELGKLADLRSERKTASSHFKQAEQLADEDNDATGRHAAKRWIRKAYRP